MTPTNRGPRPVSRAKTDQFRPACFFALCLCLTGLFSACEPAANKSEPFEGAWVDLTHDFSSETLYWPTSDLFTIDTVAVGQMEAGFYYESYKIATAEHGGTHLDAPVHFAENRPSAEQVPIERLTGPGCVIDVSEKASVDRDYLINVEDITGWEAVHGKIPDGAILLFRTGNGKNWPDAKSYMGTDLRGPEGVAELHFPGLDPEAADWLVNNRSIDAVGIDTPSIDYGQSTSFQSHVTLFEAEIPAFENVANLESLPETGMYIIALPMKIWGGSGGPLRIVAFIPSRE